MFSSSGPLRLALRLSLTVTLLLAGCGTPSRSSSPANMGQTVTPIPGTVSAPQSFTFQGTSYAYWVFTPLSFNPIKPPPALLLVHGAGGRGLDMISVWQHFADQSGLLLVAPTVPYGAAFEAIAAQLFPQLMNAVKQNWAFDTHRVSVFGVSAGGYNSYEAATLASTYFTAAGVFAAVITPDYDWIVSAAKRKTPIAIYIGDHDQFFPIAEARRTRDLLVASGFPVHYTEFPNLGHDYGAVSDQVNRDFWQYASRYALP